MLQQWFNIRKGEEHRSFLMWAYIFLVVSTIMVIKPISHAQFLSQFGAEQLPFVFILVAVIAALVSTLYTRLLGQLDFVILIRRTLNTFIIFLICVWIFLSAHFIESFILYVFFIFVSIFAVIATSQFWILANIIFNPREAKRLFGFIGAGAITGGILGGYMTKMFVPFFGSENLILMGAGFLAICNPVVTRIWNENPAYSLALKGTKSASSLQKTSLPIHAIFSSRHLYSLAVIILLSVAAGKFVDYEFNAIAAQRIQDEEQLASFLGFWYSNLNVASLLIQLFLTRRVVGVFGIGTSLLIHPLAILLGSMGVLFFPALWSAIFLKVSDGSLKNSIQKAGIELFSLPIPPEIRNPARSFIDVFGDSFATGVSGLLLLILTIMFNVPVRYISLIILVIVVIWMYYVKQVRFEYLKTVRQRIETTPGKKEIKAVDLQNESILNGLILLLSGKKESEIISTLKMVREIRNDRLLPSFEQLLGHHSWKVRLEALRNLYFYGQDFSSEIRPLIDDDSLEIKTEAIQYLFQHDHQNGIQMVTALLDHPEQKISSAALLCAARESRNNPVLLEDFKIRERVENCFRTTLRDVSHGQIVELKKTCAGIIGAAQIPDLNHFLHILIRDPSNEVVNEALLAAGRTREKMFLPVLMRHLTNRVNQNIVLEALKFYQSDILELLVRWMTNPQEDYALRIRIPQIIAQLGTQRAVDVLDAQISHADENLRYAIIQALYHLRCNHSQLRFDDKQIVKRILEETRLYTETLAVLYAQTKPIATARNDLNKNEQSARLRLIRALERKLDRLLETIFKLLGLKYPLDDIDSIYQVMRSKKKETRLDAVEFLDNLLDGPVKRSIMPIVESTLMDDLVERTLEKFGLPIPSEFECLSLLLQNEDTALKKATLALVTILKDQKYVPYICALLSDSEKEMQEKAENSLRKMSIL